jgi:hypothetical protein
MMELGITEQTCCNKTCNITFWLTTAHHDFLVASHNSFYCPNGHRQAYVGETEEMKRKRAERLLDNKIRYATKLERKNSALRGVITRMKNKRENE